MKLPRIAEACNRVRAAQVREVEREGVTVAMVAIVGGIVIAGAVLVVTR